MKVAAIQMVSSSNLDENLTTALKLIEQAAQQGANLVLLPENFALMGSNHQALQAIAEYNPDILHSPIQQAIAQAARDHHIWIAAGTLPIKSAEATQHFYNSTLVFNPQGEQVARYDKIHLFQLDQQERYDERQHYLPGSLPVTFDYVDPQTEDSYKIGLAICFDLRFPELFRALSAPLQKPCDLFLLPAAFVYTTGQAHWEVLLRARAIENQCYVVASGQGGMHDNSRRTWGHSMIIDPWGTILAEQERGEGVILSDIDLLHLQSIRQQLPALKSRMLLDSL